VGYFGGQAMANWLLFFASFSTLTAGSLASALMGA
jgi:hypothetical protein